MIKPEQIKYLTSEEEKELGKIWHAANNRGNELIKEKKALQEQLAKLDDIINTQQAVKNLIDSLVSKFKDRSMTGWLG